ncbi:MAG: exodeoxyribonuclease VII small subunit [Deltaproteobacteria bacterium]|nr:exodeoxyribonuclease VII small subunit [Deltaproteobacteria bacterium]MBI3077519.1 exodeoxyribonuclease VII small subunit [Deltaproteobacteria bacterium]
MAQESGPEPSFEEALKRLEGIVQRLEEGKLSLEESLQAFEEGVKLSALCARRLDEVERKVEVLLKDRSTGQLRAEPFAPEEE